MTAPRQVLPGTIYLVTRRCLERRFFLRPSAASNRLFLFILALAAHRFGIRLHAYCVLSNHFHLVLTDPRGTLPAFSQYLDSLVARSFNALLGRSEAFWSIGSFNAVALETPNDVIAKMAYVLANPVSAGLVEHARDWPGLWSTPERIGGTQLLARRPRSFFRRTGGLAESVALQLHRPDGFASAADFDRQLRDALAALEAGARAKARTERRTFLGAEWAMALKATARPATSASVGGLKPKVAARDADSRLAALRRLSDFVSAYRAALERWRAGVRDILFPAGTYHLRVAHAVRCAAPG